MHTLRELAEFLGCRLEGDGDIKITGLADLQSATGSQVSFYTGGPRWRETLQKTSAAAVLLSESQAAHCSRPRLLVEDPYLAYARLSQFLSPAPPPAGGVAATAAVAKGARLGPGVRVEEQAVIGAGAAVGARSVIGPGAVVCAGAVVGEDCRISPRAVLHSRVRLGDRVVIHAAAVLGADGFGFAWDKRAGRWEKIVQYGGVVVGDDVEIGACTTVDCGSLGDTRIARGVKMDDQVHIAHNVRIGEDTIIAGCSAIAGSAVIGARCRLGGNVRLVNGVRVTDGVNLYGGAVVRVDVDRPGDYASGSLLLPAAKWKRSALLVRQLHTLLGKLRRAQVG